MQLTVILRVWLPDRPGALGQVASRIGAVRGDVVGIEILEREGGWAIDELTVLLPGRERLELLIREVGEVDGVRVEEVRTMTAPPPDAALEALAAARALVACAAPQSLADALVAHVARTLAPDWVAVVDTVRPAVEASHGEVPPLEWLVHFIDGVRPSAAVAEGAAGPPDVAVAFVDRSDTALAVVASRSGRPIRKRERLLVAEVAAIAGIRRAQLAPPVPFAPNASSPRSEHSPGVLERDDARR